MQSIYSESVSEEQHQHQQLPPTPPSPTPFVKEIVNSTIPVGLSLEPDFVLDGEEEPDIPAPVDEPAVGDYIPVKFTWRGGGKVVILARAGDDDWNGRQLMERESVILSSFLLIKSVTPLPGIQIRIHGSPQSTYSLEHTMSASLSMISGAYLMKCLPP
jgi:hypothetical protein